MHPQPCVAQDYALDLQHRFDRVQPYASMRTVTKRSIHAALGSEGWPQVDLSWSAAFTNAHCSSTEWMNEYARMDRHGASDHVCRITRQRAGVSTSTLPLPPSRRRYRFSTDLGPDFASRIRYMVPATSLPSLLQAHAAGRHVDLLKIDIDASWRRLQPELEPLAAARAFSVLVLEVDRRATRSALYTHGPC